MKDYRKVLAHTHCLIGKGAVMEELFRELDELRRKVGDYEKELLGLREPADALELLQRKKLHFVLSSQIGLTVEINKFVNYALNGAEVLVKCRTKKVFQAAITLMGNYEGQYDFVSLLNDSVTKHIYTIGGKRVTLELLS